MPSKRTALLILAVMAACILPMSVCAAWEWPSQMTIGGFSVTGISGSTKPDGSGSASGTLQIQGAGGQKISLTRSSGGEVTGSSSIDARVGGVGVQGSFTLNNSGLRGRGTLRTSPRPVVDASMTVDKNGRFTGSGHVELGRVGVNVSFTLSNSLDLSGSASVRDQEDTPLATYTFDGRLNLEGSGNKIDGTANGSVQRTGKLANQSTSYPISGAPVNLSNGSCSVNVGGVSVTFRFF